jgi:proteasome component ECM29
MAEPSSPAAAPPAPTDAEREDALDRMLTRLALAEDARLAPLLARVLPYAITSFASPAAPVRKLVSLTILPPPSPDSIQHEPVAVGLCCV